MFKTSHSIQMEYSGGGISKTKSLKREEKYCLIFPKFPHYLDSFKLKNNSVYESVRSFQTKIYGK